MNPLTGKTAWKIPLQDFGVSAGTLATDGGLLFTGKLTGEFIALDQDNGKQLWQFKTGSGIVAPPITYTHKGRAICNGVVRHRRRSKPGHEGRRRHADRRFGMDLRRHAPVT